MLDPASHDRTDPVSCAAAALGLARAISTRLRTDPTLQGSATGADLRPIAQGCAEGAIFANAFDASLAAAVDDLDAFVGNRTVTGTDWYPDADDTLHAYRREIVAPEARTAAEAAQALRRLRSLIERVRDLRAARRLLDDAL